MLPLHRAAVRRRGVVLLVVISLLMLFAIVGLAFVIYAEAQASTARARKEGESQRRPDMDPEHLLAYFLGQLIFDTDNPASALRGHSLARTMYGRPGGTEAFNGKGRPPGDTQVDYTSYSGPRDPYEHGGGNPPYTYPDLNNMFLAAQRASDGAVLIPSYVRLPAGGGPPISLRPNPQYHPRFPQQADASGDVKNLADSPGFLMPDSQVGPNDSIWIDAGHPVMTAPDGRKFKPLFAPLILDMDGRINLNANGNLIGKWLTGTGTKTYSISHQGSSHSEVALDYVLDWPARDKNTGNEEVHNLFWGYGGIAGRYDPNTWPVRMDSRYDQPGFFYSPTNQDCWPENPPYENLELPRLGSGIWAPKTEHAFSNGWPTGYDLSYTGLPFNFFDPTKIVYNSGGVRTSKDRVFKISDLEALLRYRDTGSPALASDLFMLCPRSFGDPQTGGKVRRLVTTHAFDVNVPGAVSPDGRPLPPRLDLARRFDTYYPDVQDGVGTFANYNDPRVRQQYQQAAQERRQLAREIFERLKLVKPPADADATARLAQLAVNLVDFIQTPRVGGWNCPCDVMTGLDYEPGRWVFGTVLPRLVINEVYAEAGSGQNSGVSFWVELCNTFKQHEGGGNPKVNHHNSVGHSENATARLWVDNPGYAVYRLHICTADGNDMEIARPTNALGEPMGVLKTIDRYQPQPEQGDDKQQPRLMGDDLNKVRPANTADTPYKETASGDNKGFYVIGPPQPLPGTEQGNELFATLPLRDMKDDQGSTNSRYTLVLQRLACPYLPPQESPDQPDYNPYVTVDFVDRIEPNDGAKPADQRHSVGRNQPFAASVPNLVKQTPSQPKQSEPRHTFFKMNSQKEGSASPVFAYDWMIFLNRPPLSAVELLFVSGYAPAMLTQKFSGPPDGNGIPRAEDRFGHRAPWFDPAEKLHGFFEFIEAYSRYAWSPIGGRNAGKINLNTVWDFEVFQGLCDRHSSHYYTAAGLKSVWEELRFQSRTRGENPTLDDRPFRGMAPGDGDVEDTFFRASVDPGEEAKPPPQRRRLFEPRLVLGDPNSGLRAAACPPGTQTPHPALALELLSRTYSNITTRSNVFAVWVTVGFFEVEDEGGAGRPARLGPEIGAAEGRAIRHRMFAIVDRSSLTVETDPVSGGLRPGPAPWFIDSLNSVEGNGQPEVVKVAVISAKYEDRDWRIRAGDQLVVDSGANRETVRVIAVPGDAADPNSFRAVFTRPHPRGFAISNATLGHPGPQPRFDPRNPQYRAVVRHFSIIE